VRLERTARGPLRIGHRGAAGLAPANSLEAVEAALACGVDGVEIDVVSVEGRLVAAHSAGEAGPSSPPLEDALALVAASDAFLLCDVKEAGREAELVALLQRHALAERTVVASFLGEVLRATAALEPGLTLARSYPDDRLGVSEHLPDAAIEAGLAALRRALPYRIARMLRAPGATAATLHHRVISPPLVARCRALGVPILAWTVNDREALERAEALGVDGVITDDPRIFEGG
jgi:glycerophosphoryl diester phosphodiesterase